jgi:hypothetical protein
MIADSARVIEVFTEAVQLPKAERSAFLDRVCVEDECLREKIQALLSSNDRAEGFLEEPPTMGGEGEEKAGTEEISGVRIGRYRRRRAARGDANGRLQGQLRRAADAGNDGSLGRAICEVTPDKALQPDAGSLRAGRHHVQYLLGLDHEPRPASLPWDGRRGRFPRLVQGVPAALCPAELQSGEHDGRHSARHQGEAEDRARLSNASAAAG